MKYRQIKTDFWDDSYILDLKNDEKVAFIYFFTNSKVNICGIYELPDRIICSTLGCTLDRLSKIKAKFQNDGKYYFYKNWVFISNFAEHNKYSSAPNVLKTFIKDFNSIPPEIGSHFFHKLKLQYEFPIESIVIVMVMVMDKYPTPYPRIKEKGNEENINPDEVKI